MESARKSVPPACKNSGMAGFGASDSELRERSLSISVGATFGTSSSSSFAAEHRLLLYGVEHISLLDLLVAISTDKPDSDQGFTFRIPLAPVGQPNLLALRTPRIGMGIPRIIPREKPLARSVQQVVTKVRLSPIAVSVAVDGSLLVSSRFAYLQVRPSCSDAGSRIGCFSNEPHTTQIRSLSSENCKASGPR